jgi:signal transduction histidine kinase
MVCCVRRDRLQAAEAATGTKAPRRDTGMAAHVVASSLYTEPSEVGRVSPEVPAPRARAGWLGMPAHVRTLRDLLQAQSRIEARIVTLHWVVMALVGVGAVLPKGMGFGLHSTQSLLVLGLLVLHPIAYVGVAGTLSPWLRVRPSARAAVFTAIDVTVAIGVLFVTATRPGYSQVLLFTLVLLSATRYSLRQALSITSLLAVLQFFAIVAADSNMQITTTSSAIVAMFAMTVGVNQLSRAERIEAAGAAENARLYHQVLLRNRELATINALAQSASLDTDAERLLESGMELILASLEVPWGQAYRYHREGETLELLFLRRGQEAGDGAAEDQQEARRAARTRGVVAVRPAGYGPSPFVRVSVPVITQGSAVGVMQASMPGPQEDHEEVDPAQSLAIACRELGALLDRALLREAAQRTLVLEEKHRIARELHDTVLQLLFTSNLRVEWGLQQVSEQSPLQRTLTEIRGLTAQASQELRSAIYTLISPVAEIGLVPAIEQLTGTFSDQYGTPVSFSTSGLLPEDVPVLAQNALHRVVRESLMNVYKHAQASHATVRLVSTPQAITVVVQDDGIGLPARVEEHQAGTEGHFGLRTLKRQVEDLHGQFAVRAGEDGGTIVRATVPM